MSHELTERANGYAEMAYVGEKPWHGLGQELTAGASIEEWQKAAGMDWRINRSKVRYFADRDGREQREFPAHHVLMRSDTKAPLAIVSERYKVVQPGEALEFFRDLTEDAGFKLETAGTMFGGKKFWALARVAGAAAEVVKGDTVNAFLLFASSCDYSLSTTVDETAVRVVCNNTISCALSCASAKRIVISHRSKLTAERIAAIKQQMGLVGEDFNKFIDAARALAKIRVTQRDAASFVIDLLKPGLDDAEFDGRQTAIDKVRDSRGFQSIMGLFDGKALGSGIAGVRGTAWALLNAISEYTDHRAQARTDSNRLDSAWFGPGANLKTAALEKLLTLA